jgi:hypothetical protein
MCFRDSEFSFPAAIIGDAKFMHTIQHDLLFTMTQKVKLRIISKTPSQVNNDAINQVGCSVVHYWLVIPQKDGVTFQ